MPCLSFLPLLGKYEVRMIVISVQATTAGYCKSASSTYAIVGCVYIDFLTLGKHETSVCHIELAME